MKKGAIICILVLLLSVLAGCGDDGWQYEKILAEFERTATYYKITGYTGDKTELTVPTKYQHSPVVFVGKEAFAGNQTVKKIVVPEGVAELRDRAFADCPNLTEVRIPLSITRMGEDLFAGSDQVTLIVFSGSMGEEYATAHGIPHQVVE